MEERKVKRIGDGQVLKAFIAWVLARATSVPADFLQKLLTTVPPLVKAAVPLPSTAGEVAPYLSRVGIGDPLAPVATLLLESLFGQKADQLLAAAEDDPELHFLLYEADEETAVDYIVQMAREELDRQMPPGAVGAVDPMSIILLIQTLAPIVLDLLKKWRDRRNPQPTPVAPPIK